MEHTFNGSNLRLARSCHGYALNDVADAVGKSRQFINRLEMGRDEPTPELAEELAQFLEVLPGFFYESAGMLLGEESYHFRKYATTKVSSKQAALAKGELFRRFVAFIDGKLNLPPTVFPSFEVTTLDDIERAAEKSRIAWGLGFGPIVNMIRVAENAGAVVTTFHSVSTQVDALSISSKRPIIVTNNNKGSSARIRFDIAHEIGHFIMHEGRVTGDRVSEGEANRFAGAFLMPRSTFVKEFNAVRHNRFDWAAMKELKVRWKVSKAAILYRARQLDLITEAQYKNGIVIGLYRRGERTSEKDDDLVAAEYPELIHNALSVLHDHLGYSIEDVAAAVHMRRKMLKHFLPDLLELDGSTDSINTQKSVVSLDAYRSRRSH